MRTTTRIVRAFTEMVRDDQALASLLNWHLADLGPRARIATSFVSKRHVLNGQALEVVFVLEGEVLDGQ